MQKLEKSAFINAPVEEVFDYWKNPVNQPEVWPSLVEVKDVQEIGRGRYKWKWVYKLAGMRFEGQSEVVEFIPNQKIAEKSSGGIDSTFTWEFIPENNGTRLNMSVEYNIPMPLLGKVAESFVTKQSANEADVVFANMKARLEK
jgi:uncharacterized membrane protein